MSDKYFQSDNEVNPLTSIVESDRVLDIRDDKWAHPDLKEGWDTPEGGLACALYDPAVSLEEKKEQAQLMIEMALSFTNQDASANQLCDINTYKISGCPEEPDAMTEVLVYRPKDLHKKKARVLFYCVGGALTMCEPAMYPIADLAVRYNCAVVVPKYRLSWEAQYPAAINDLHAGYKWMIENAEMLRINPDNVVIHGTSTGAHLGTALAFRIKRYGYSPKGVVAFVPQTDDRERGNNQNYIYSGVWDSITQHDCLAQWLGKNFASSRVGPEALANHATVEDCIGYPPLFIHSVELDPDRDNNNEFYNKVIQARSYAEYHCWGGAHHASAIINAVNPGELSPYNKRVRTIIDGNIEDCFNYDLRRPWVVEEHQKKNK